MSESDCIAKCQQKCKRLRVIKNAPKGTESEKAIQNTEERKYTPPPTYQEVIEANEKNRDLWESYVRGGKKRSKKKSSKRKSKRKSSKKGRKSRRKRRTRK